MTGLSQRNQVPCQIPTVHTRDVQRLEWTQILGVVPVVQMPTKFLEAEGGVEGCLELIGHVRHAQPAQIVGRNRRDQRQPNVGR